MDAIEEADLYPDQAEKVMHEFEKEVHLLTAESRLRAIVKDFVGHYSDLWTTGKAMFVCLNKVTCARMYNFVQEYWQEEIKAHLYESLGFKECGRVPNANKYDDGTYSDDILMVCDLV